MDNIEFCNLVKEAREISGTSTIDLVIGLRKSEAAISQLVKPKCDYNMVKYLEYLQVIGFYIVVSSKQCGADISSEEDLNKWAKNVIEYLSLSSYQLGELLAIAQSTAYSIMNGGTMRLSIFLKLVDILEGKITLEAII